MHKTGAVLVVGGGIGGIQASLDLAESGFKVYLLEKNPSIIGGHMPQLDKTFPTNDCSILKFGLEEVFCIGCCGQAPGVVVNEEIYGYMTQAKVKKVLEEYS